MRFGISTMDGILPKSLRTRRPHSMLRAIHPPRPVPRGWARLTAVTRSGKSGAAPGGDTFSVSGEPTATPRSAPLRTRRLFDFHRGADLLELLLHVRRFRLGHLLLHRLRRPVHEILGLLQAQTGQLAHHLDDLDLLLARRVQHHVELGLLLAPRRGSRRRPAARGRRHRHRGGRRDAPFLLQQLRKLGRLQQRQRVQLLRDLFDIRRHLACLLWMLPSWLTTTRPLRIACYALRGSGRALAGGRPAAIPAARAAPEARPPADSAGPPSTAAPPAPSARRARRPSLPRAPP